jgi:hypothetical protein
VRVAIERQREKLANLVTRVDTALEERKAEYEARRATLQSQRAQAREQHRAHIDARVEELQASYEARRAKLTDARRLAKESADLFREAVAP